MLENIHKPGDSYSSWVLINILFWIYPDATEGHPLSWAKEYVAIFSKRAVVKNAALADNGKGDEGGGGGEGCGMCLL